MSMLPPVRHRKDSERGFALLMVFLLAAGIALMLYSQVPRVAFESERDKEQLLIDRGGQYQRAIGQYFIAFKRYPATIEDLEHSNDKRFLRKRYVDPYTGKDDWRLVHSNGQFLTDSLVTKPPTGALDPNNPNKDQVAGAGGAAGAPGATSGATGAGGVAQPLGVAGPAGAAPAGSLPPITIAGAGQPNTPAQVNPAVLRRPSDRVGAAGAGQFTPGAPPPDPNNPYATATNPQDPNNPNQNPAQAVNFPGQGFPGQSLPGQAPIQPGFPAQPQQTDPFNNSGQLSPGDFPPISLQAIQAQQGNTGQNPGQAPGQFPGQFPGQNNGQFPGQPGLPGQPGGNQVRIGQNGQFIPVTQPAGGVPQGVVTPGVPGFPAGQGQQPFPGQQNFPQPAPTDPSQTAGLAGSGVNAPSNNAIGLINQLLTTPRQPPAGVATGAGNTSTGLGIAGIASKYEGATVKIYKEKQKFKEWEFVFDPNANAPKVPAPTNPLGTQNGTGNSPTGATTGTSPFGTTPITQPTIGAPSTTGTVGP